MTRDIISLMVGGGTITVFTRGLASGNSIIADGSGKGNGIAKLLFTNDEKKEGYACDNLAVPGDTISGQNNKWNALPFKIFDWVVVQVGLNDMNTSNISATISSYQSYINAIKSAGQPGMKIVVSCMSPAKQRFIDLGWANGQSNWTALNNAIMTSITNVDGRINSHVALLSDGSGNLAPAYNSGDNIHVNDAGALIIRDAWRQKLIDIGMIV